MQPDSLQFQDSTMLVMQPDSGIVLEDSLPVSRDTSATVFGLLFGDSSKFEPVPNKVYKNDQKSLFKTQQVQSLDYKSNTRHSLNLDWITLHVVICLVLISWVQIFYGKRLRQILKAFGGTRYANILSKEGNLFRERISIPLFIVYLVTFSLLIYQVVAGQSAPNMSGFSGLKFFSLIILVILLLWFVKNIAVRFVGTIFKNQVILSDYMHTNFIFNMATGLILLPLIIISVYLPSVLAIYIVIAIWLVVFFYRFVRELFTGLNYTKFSLFARILYLCAFEILPFLVFTKLVLNYIG